MASLAAPTLWDCEPVPQDSAPAAERPIMYARRPDPGMPCAHMPEARTARAEPTLDQMISRLWQTVTGHQSVTCPWCDGEMRPRYSAATRPVGARCTDCGATLS